MREIRFIVLTDAEADSLTEAEITDAVGETLRELEGSHVTGWRIEKSS
jgi:hypothetical protein